MTQKQERKIKNLSHHNGYAKNKGKNRKICWRLLYNLLIILIISSGIYYVISINDLSAKGFVMQELKIKLADISNKNKDMELKIMELESYENIDQRADNLKMVKVDKIDYFTIVNEAMAKK
jgi:hypothetical protein